MPSPPAVRLFVLCESVLEDLTSGAVTLRGVMETVRGVEFPAECGGLLAYVRVAGRNGEYRFGVQVVAPDLEAIVAEADTAALTESDPLKPLHIVLPVPDFEVPEPGRYSVRLTCNGRLVHETPFQVEGST